MYRNLLAWLAVVFLSCPAQGQEDRKIPISFLPPPLETATYSLGIYDAKTGKLVRRLKEAATQETFTVGLNGLITNWDGKDDTGKTVPTGKYAVRGYAVGAFKIEGEEITGNDWTDDDENLRIRRVRMITVLPDGVGLGILAETAAGALQTVCYDAGGKLCARETGTSFPHGLTPDRSTGKDETTWKIEDGGVLTQSSPGGERLRELTPKSGEPVPVAVAASPEGDRLYLLEEVPGWQRIRGLSWVETKQEEGKPVSTWQTFFERNIRMPHPTPGLNPTVPVEIALAENPLDPGKLQKASLVASFDDQGSYLTTADGLRLRRISQRVGLTAATLSKGKTAHGLSLRQSDGAAWDEFSIEGVKNMMAFDAGEIDMTAEGEKPHPEKATEPPDL